MKALKLGFWALLFIGIVSFCVTFATQNNDLMTVNLINYTTEPTPKWQILLLAALAGAILSALFFIIEMIVLESKNIVLRRVNKKMERALQKQSAPESIAKQRIVSGSDLESDV
ncbi:MAG: lipopolysaccharide assembly protein LapA domain-containing protein [Bdellovibrionota bacterium]